jgi:hypothetical protein
MKSSGILIDHPGVTGSSGTALTLIDHAEMVSAKADWVPL